jgi:hypothetical protein
MAQTRIYKFPSGDLDWVGPTVPRIAGHSRGLTLLLENPERTIATNLDMEDLKRLVLDLASAIHTHKDALCVLKDAPAQHHIRPPMPPS